MTDVREPGIVDALGLLTTYGDEIVLGTVRDTHRAWAGRVYGAMNRATKGKARGVQLVHDGISSTIYGSIGVALSAGTVAFRAAGSQGVGPRLDDSPRGRFARAALNGL